MITLNTLKHPNGVCVFEVDSANAFFACLFTAVV
jgi:hypothetical protein